VFVSGQLKSVNGMSGRLLHVYSESVESEDLALRGHVTTHKPRACEPRAAASACGAGASVCDRSMALHHLVRDGDSPAAQYIRTVDQRRHDYHHDDEFVTSEQYRAAVREREQELLMTADVILCTCITAGSARITSSSNVVQVTLSVCLSVC